MADNGFALFVSKWLPSVCVRGWTVKVLAEMVHGPLQDRNNLPAREGVVFVTVLAAGSHNILLDGVEFKRSDTVRCVQAALFDDPKDVEASRLFTDTDLDFSAPLYVFQELDHIPFDKAKTLTLVAIKLPSWNHLLLETSWTWSGCIAWHPVQRNTFAEPVQHLVDPFGNEYKYEVMICRVIEKKKPVIYLQDHIMCNTVFPVQLVVWHPQGGFLAIATSPTNTSIWNTKTKRCVKVYNHASPIQGCWDCTGTLHAVRASGTINVYDARFKCVASLGKWPMGDVGWHPTKQWIWRVNVDTVYITDVSDHRSVLVVTEVFTNPRGPIQTCAWNCDGSLLAVATTKRDHIVVYDGSSFTPTNVVGSCVPAFLVIHWHPTNPLIFATNPYSSTITYLTRPKPGEVFTWDERNQLVQSDGEPGFDTTLCVDHKIAKMPDFIGWNSTGDTLCVCAHDVLALFRDKPKNLLR